jgi:hypothetical protein
VPDAHSPYRAAERAPGPRVVLYPLLQVRLVLTVLGAVLVTLFFYATKDSRRVTVACERDAGRAAPGLPAAPEPGRSSELSCEIREESFVSSRLDRRHVSDVVDVRIGGVASGTRGDAWIEVVTSSGVVRLTPGLDVAKRGQAAAARAMAQHVRAGDPVFTVGFAVPAEESLGTAIGLIVALAGAFFMTLRVLVAVDAAHRLLIVETRRFPLPARRVATPLDEVQGFRWFEDIGGRPKVQVVLRSGEAFPLFTAHGMRVEETVARLTALLAAAREA